MRWMKRWRGNERGLFVMGVRHERPAPKYVHTCARVHTCTCACMAQEREEQVMPGATYLVVGAELDRFFERKGRQRDVASAQRAAALHCGRLCLSSSERETKRAGERERGERGRRGQTSLRFFTSSFYRYSSLFKAPSGSFSRACSTVVSVALHFLASLP